MFRKLQSPVAVAGMILAVFFSRSLLAEEQGYESEVRSCVAAVTSRLELDDARRVRHVIKLLRRTGIGQVLEIDTSVFTDSSERSYSAYCVANGDATPVKFRFQETTA